MVMQSYTEDQGVLYKTEKSGVFNNISEPRPLLRRVNDQYIEYLEKAVEQHSLSPEDRFIEDYMVNFKEIAENITRGMMAKATETQLNVLGVINKGVDYETMRENVALIQNYTQNVQDNKLDEVQKGLDIIQGKLRDSYKRTHDANMGNINS